MANSESLLAHLTHKLTAQSENVATEALLYLLEHHSDAAEAFSGLVRRYQPDLPDITAYRAQDWAVADGAIPDLVGIDVQGRTSLVVEAKFWAPLTPNQPCAYHDRLSKDGPGLLLFLCPRQRAASLLAELTDRCEHAHAADGESVMDVGRGRRMAVTTWHGLLDELEHAMREAGNGDGLSDLRQVRGLVEGDDGQVFLPLESDELSGRIGHRLGQYMGLIEGVVADLQRDATADVKGLKLACRAGQAYGRYFRLADHEAQLVVHFGYWANERDTPLWLMITLTAAHSADLLAATVSARNEHPPRLLERDGYLVAPLPLPVGVPEHVLVDQTSERVRDLAALLP